MAPQVYVTNFLVGFSDPTDPCVTAKFEDLHGSLDFESKPCPKPPFLSAPRGKVGYQAVPPSWGVNVRSMRTKIRVVVGTGSVESSSDNRSKISA